MLTSQQQSDAPAGFFNSLKTTVSTIDSSLVTTDFYQIEHFIEGYNIADFNWGTSAAQTIALSFWAKASQTGTYAITISNSDGSANYPSYITINSANTWEYETIIVPGPTFGTWNLTNGTGLGIRFGFGYGSTTNNATPNVWNSTTNYANAFYTPSNNMMATLNATFYITGVQLEKGPVATGFDFRDSASELQLCQRYYEPRSVYSYAKTTQFDSNGWGFVAQYSTKRAVPTLTCTNAFSNPSSRVTTTAAIITSTAAIDGGRLFVSAEL